MTEQSADPRVEVIAAAYPRLLQWARRGAPDLREDALQTAVLEFLQKIQTDPTFGMADDGLPAPGRLIGGLLKGARFRLLDELSELRRQRKADDLEDLAGPGTPEETVLARDELTMALGVIDELDAVTRRALLLRADGLSMDSIAGQLGIIPNTLAKRLSRVAKAAGRPARRTDRRDEPATAAPVGEAA